MAATPATLIAQFPAFAAVDEATVEFWLTRAATVVTFDDPDDLAQMLWSAHYLTINGYGSGTDAQLAAQGLAGASSIRSGSLSVTFDKGAALTGFGSTVYGRQYLDLARAAGLGGPLVAPTGAMCDALLDPRIPRWPC